MFVILNLASSILQLKFLGFLTLEGTGVYFKMCLETEHLCEYC